MYINYSFDLLTTGQKLYWQISISAKGFPRCLKITEKVSLIIASEASYVYTLKVDKGELKTPKMVDFGDYLKLEARSHKV